MNLFSFCSGTLNYAEKQILIKHETQYYKKGHGEGAKTPTACGEGAGAGGTSHSYAIRFYVMAVLWFRIIPVPN